MNEPGFETTITAMTITMTNDQVIDIYIDIVVNIWINEEDKDNDSDVYNDKNKKTQNKLWLMSKLCVNSIQDINSEGQWRVTLDGQKFQFLLCLVPKLNSSQHHWCHQAFCIFYSLILNILKKNSSLDETCRLSYYKLPI